jgi:hypothetical protein
MTYLDIYTVGSAPGDNSEQEPSKLDQVKSAFRKSHPGIKFLIIIILLGIIAVSFLGFLELVGVPIFHKDSDKEVETPVPAPTPATVTDPITDPVADTVTDPITNPDSDKASFTNMEPFTNDLPYQLNNESLNLSPDLDYNDFLQKMSLDQDVVKQHNQYVNDRNKVTSTASFAPSRSDNQDIVTTWGLTKPTYVPVDPSARNVPSQDPEQGSKPVRLQWK